MDTTKLWKWERTIGRWDLVKTVGVNESDAYLKVFQRAESLEAFLVSERKPKGRPVFPNYMYMLGIA